MKRILYDGSTGFAQNQLLQYWMLVNVILLQSNSLFRGLSACIMDHTAIDDSMMDGRNQPLALLLKLKTSMMVSKL